MQFVTTYNNTYIINAEIQQPKDRRTLMDTKDWDCPIMDVMNQSLFNILKFQYGGRFIHDTCNLTNAADNNVI